MKGGASIEGPYRYLLWRDWAPPRQDITRSVAFVMLNPSTADSQVDDPTIRRCIDFARRWGYDAMNVVNLFALRATDPRELLRHPDPVGPANDGYIQRFAGRADLVIAAWGANRAVPANALTRTRALVEPRALRVLGLTKAGYPRHPLYMPRDCGHHEIGDLFIEA